LAGSPDRVGLRGGPRAPFAHYFFDDFSGVALDRRGWEAAVGVTLTSEILDRGQPTAAARLAANQTGAARQPELCSAAIGLAGAGGVELSYSVQHRGAEAGERLAVEYLSESGAWHTVEYVVADARDSVGFSLRKHLLPADALHDALRIRFRPQADDSDDAWYLGDVALVSYEPMCTLTVRTHPARSVPVEVVLEWRPDGVDGVAPFTRSLPVGSSVHLVAPPTVDDRVFSHWSVDGETRTERQRVLSLEVRSGVELVAHYRPWVPGRSEASVTMLSTPEPGVTVSVGAESERLYTHVRTDTELACLTGEWLALLAPQRTARMAFAAWTVNGEALPSGESFLEHRVRGDDLLVAQYVLLGDVNGDDMLDKFDVEVFVAALIDPSGYARQFPDLDLMLRGDVNGDGAFDALDVEDFVDLLLSD
jgi:hypothetical protein